MDQFEIKTAIVPYRNHTHIWLVERNNVEYILKKYLKSGNHLIKDEPDKEKTALELLKEHKNIIKYFKYFETDDSYNFILEHCPNDSLETFMKRFEAPIELMPYYMA